MTPTRLTALVLMVLLPAAACGTKPDGVASPPPSPTATTLTTPDVATADPGHPYSKPDHLSCQQLPSQSLATVYGPVLSVSDLAVESLQIIGSPEGNGLANSYTCRTAFRANPDAPQSQVTTSLIYLASGRVAAAYVGIQVGPVNRADTTLRNGHLVAELGQYAVSYDEATPPSGRIGASYVLLVLQGNLVIRIWAVRMTAADGSTPPANTDDQGRDALIRYARESLSALT
jgi:hypothetical protein